MGARLSRLTSSRPPASGASARNNRREQMRRVTLVVQHGLMGNLHTGAGEHVLSGVEIAIEAREIRTRNLHPQAMAGAKQIAGGRHLAKKQDYLTGNLQIVKF